MGLNLDFICKIYFHSCVFYSILVLKNLKHCFLLNSFTEATPDKDSKKGSDTGQSKLFTKEK